MEESKRTVERLYEEFMKFEKAMEELHFLKRIAQDLKSFKKMLRLKKYD